ncbi:uncharacterized mitochondrial protein AtMg00860-like [Penaeus monodon]|uniref:uncharacterized mitochondrial protein AtMg00860-like n=1 Tax=Penaeus monodon TaxID=6687 RepID=UPI0018A728DF|nr:uncharacterized mitochondrial protein AtMg00860-like [Penaeus monodon]
MPSLLLREVDFLGHVVSQEGIKEQPQKIKAIRDFPRPKTLRELQSFLGLANYYCKFLENFSKMARPLYELTKDGEEKTKPSQLIDWNNEAEMSFVKIKDTFKIRQKEIIAPLNEKPLQRYGLKVNRPPAVGAQIPVWAV